METKSENARHRTEWEFERYQGQWYLTLNRSGKNAPMRLRSERTVSIENQAKKSHNPFLLNNIGDGILLPQAIPGGTGTRRKAGGAHESSILFLFVAG